MSPHQVFTLAPMDCPVMAYEQMPVPADLQSAGLEYGDLQSPKYVSRLPITCWFTGQR